MELDLENGTTGEEENQEPQVSPEELQRLAKELEKQQKALAKGFQEIAERERQMGLRGDSAQEDDEVVEELDPKAQKILDKYLDKRIGSVVQTVEDNYREDVLAEIDDASKAAGIDPDTLVETIERLNLQPRSRSIRAARESIKAAVDIIKAQSAPSYDELLEKAKKEILEGLESEGTRVEGVRPKRTVISEHSSGDLDDVSEDERYRILKERGIPSSF